ncbi:MAG: T9SS type A sorting domain-containing protein [Flavobacteriales bacterium]
MKQLATLLAFLPFGLIAQTTWQVEAGGSTAGSTLPYYLPANITIAAGDVVHWTGVSGTHNVYGMLDVFPNNPEGFTSGQPAPGLNYTHTFTVAGVYQYHCTMQGHAATQFGTITVTASTAGIASQAGTGPFKIFPQPAQDELTLDPGAGYSSAEILNVAGAVVRTAAVEGNDRQVIDLSGLPSGTFMLRLRDAQGHTATQPFVKQ